MSELASGHRHLHFLAKCASKVGKFKFYVPYREELMCHREAFVPHREAFVPHREAFLPYREELSDTLGLFPLHPHIRLLMA